MRAFVFAVIFAIFALATIGDAKKHPNDLDEPQRPSDKKVIFSKLNRPFRMEKLNLIWTKAQHRLEEPELQSFFTHLKIQDKEELMYKQYEAENDKDGVAAAKLRKKLIDTMDSFGLLDAERKPDTDQSTDTTNTNRRDDQSDKSDVDAKKFTKKEKSLYKLDKMWKEAEASGLSVEELNALKEEFAHYQEKVDMYYSLFDDSAKNRYANAIDQDEHDLFNEVIAEDELLQERGEYLENANALREKHRDLKETYNNLKQRMVEARQRRQFVEPKVQKLWKTAQESNFTEKELAALKEELFHFESRLLKLSHLHAEHAVSNEKQKVKKHIDYTEKVKDIEKNIKKQSRKVEKLQEDLERQIYNHVEL